MNSQTGQKKLVTYRAESINQPNTRVHSVRPLNSNSQFVASSYSYENDEVYSIIVQESLDPEDDEPFIFYRLYTGAPYFFLDSSSVKSAGDILVTFVGIFDSGNPDEIVIINKTQVLSLRQMPNSISVKTVGNKLAFPNSQTAINLDNYIQISGGHVANVEPADPTNGAISVVNRFSASNQFNNVSVEFEQSIMDQNLIFGFKDGELVLLQDGVLITSVKVGRLISMDSAGDGTTFYALTLTNPAQGVLNNIFVFLLVDGNWRVMQYTLSTGTYVDMRFFKLDLLQYGFAAWREAEYRIEVATLRMDLGSGNTLLMGSSLLSLQDTILDFSLAYLQRDGYVLVISSEIQSEQSNFDLFRVVVDPLNNFTNVNFQGRQLLPLVPGTDLVPSEVEYDCVVDPFKTLTVDCMHAETNMYSYYVSYTLTPSTIPTGQFITAMVNNKLYNIVNTKPVRVRVDLNYSAIILQNIDSSSLLLPAEYVLAIYAFNYQDTYFRILTPQDLGFDNSTGLRDLDPCFFQQAGTNGTKLGLNVGKQGKSNSTIRVFNIDGLRLVINKPNELNSNPALRFSGLGASATNVELDQIFAGIEDPKKKKSHKALYIILASVVVLLGIILFVAYKMSRGTPDDSSYIKESLQETRIDAENTIKAGVDSSNLPA